MSSKPARLAILFILLGIAHCSMDILSLCPEYRGQTFTDKLSGKTINWDVKQTVENQAISEKIGEGGFGKVYATADPFPAEMQHSRRSTGAPSIVIKVLKFDPATLPQEVADRFIKEFEVAFQMSATPYAPYTYGCQYDLLTKQVYLVMERMETDFCKVDFVTNFRKQNNLSRLRAYRDMVAGVKALADIDVVHNDIKPDNFMADATGKTIVMIDFGITSKVGSKVDSVGTAPFIAPGRYNPNNKSKPFDDLYSIALMICQIESGRQIEFVMEPFGKKGNNVKDCYDHHLDQDCVDLIADNCRSVLRKRGFGDLDVAAIKAGKMQFNLTGFVYLVLAGKVKNLRPQTVLDNLNPLIKTCEPQAASQKACYVETKVRKEPFIDTNKVDPDFCGTDDEDDDWEEEEEAVDRRRII